MRLGLISACLAGTSGLILMLGARVAAEGVWEARAPLPIATGELIGAAVDERPVLTGGLGPEWSVSSRVFTYDPAGDVWEGLPDLPAPLNHHAAAVANGILYVMGGATDFAHGMVERPDVYALSPGASAWEERAPMPEARWGPAIRNEARKRVRDAF